MKVPQGFESRSSHKLEARCAIGLEPLPESLQVDPDACGSIEDARAKAVSFAVLVERPDRIGGEQWWLAVDKGRRGFDLLRRAQAPE